MKNILLVDDDPVILRIYRDGLSQRGFKVSVAVDGLEAVTSLRMVKPDLIILDLMMPKLSGADVLRYLRAEPDYASIPVIVFSNAYLNELGREAAKHGVARALLKVRCTPALLIKSIEDVFAGRPAEEDPAGDSLAVANGGEGPAPAKAPEAAKPAGPLTLRADSRNAIAESRVEKRATAAAALVPVPTKIPQGPGPCAVPAQQPPGTVFTDSRQAPDQPQAGAWNLYTSSSYTESLAKARSEFLDNVPQTREGLGELLKAFLSARTDSERLMRLRDLYRKVHFITSMAGLADCPPIGQMASAFEALLFELMARPSLISASPLATAKASVDFLGQLLESAPELTFSVRLKARVLVVDDDRLSSRLFVASLQEAHLQARSTQSPRAALELAKQGDFQLFLLDVEMPEMSGFELCKQIRALPKYENTPIVYVTNHSDFQNRSQGLLSGGNDLIAKPVLAPELAVKAVMHLLKNQLGL